MTVKLRCSGSGAPQLVVATCVVRPRIIQECRRHKLLSSSWTRDKRSVFGRSWRRASELATAAVKRLGEAIRCALRPTDGLVPGRVESPSRVRGQPSARESAAKASTRSCAAATMGSPARSRTSNPDGPSRDVTTFARRASAEGEFFGGTTTPITRTTTLFPSLRGHMSPLGL